MNSTKALRILARRMSQGQQHEREAFNYLVDYVSNEQKRTIVRHQLYGKMYIYLLGQFVRHFQCTVFDPIPQKELHKILDKPLRSIVKEFVDTVNMGEMYEDPNGDPAKWGYDEVAENLRAMINKSIEEYEQSK